jgi:hypothetical protein
VPTTIKRTNVPQYFRFDLVVAPVVRDASGNKVDGAPLARIPVVIKVPELDAGSASYVRDYDANAACIPGTRVVWAGFRYNTLAPDNIVGKDSRVEFFVSTADTQAGLAAANSPAEKLLATATRINVTPNCTTNANPRTEACNRVDLKQAFLRFGELPNRRWVRVRVKLSASPDFTRFPTIMDWSMLQDCVPSE